MIDGNKTFLASAAAGLSAPPGPDGVYATADDNLCPVAAGPLDKAAVNAAADACVPSKPWGFAGPFLQQITSPTCGGLVAARNGAVRSLPATIGAFEAR